MKTFKVALLFCAVFTVNGKPVDEDVSEDDGKIVGGLPGAIGDYPYIASLLYYDSPICGCSIISANMILTAAHCVDGVVASVLSVRVGSTYSTSGGQKLQVVRILSHEQYNKRTTDRDVAVLKLKTPITHTEAPYAAPIPLATTEPTAGTAKVCGWGTTSQGGSVSNRLMCVDVYIINRSSCKSAYGTSAITKYMICAAASGKDSCQGDSGGPLVQNGVQVGIVSWGAGCAQPKYPGVYTNVADSNITAHIRNSTEFILPN